MASASSGHVNINRNSVEGNKRLVKRYKSLAEGKEDHCGWIWIKTGLFRGWKYRFFSLRGAILSYYDTFPSEEYLGTKGDSKAPLPGFVPVKGETAPTGVYRVAHVERTNGGIAFKIFAVSGKILDLRANTPTHAADWVENLTTAAKLGRRKDIGTGFSLSCSTMNGDSSSTIGSLSEEELLRSSNFVDKHGWMKLRQNGAWRRKFFVLQGAMISNHDNDEPWTVPNTRAYVIDVTRAEQSPLGLIIKLSTGRNAIVTTESEAETNGWYESLRLTIDIAAGKNSTATA